MTPIPECTTRQTDFRGWSACYLENGYIRLVAVPDIGGRVMAYDLGAYPFFFVDPDLVGKLFTPEENQGDGSLAAWKNYGGDKTWPAPQGWDDDTQWHGPPDPILDTGRYTLNEMSSDGTKAVVRMTSPADPRTGVQITRQFTIFKGSSRVQLDITFRNVKDQPIRWGIWDVAQLRADKKNSDGTLTHDPGCTVSIPVNPKSRFPDGFNVMFGEPNNPQWQVDQSARLFTAPYLWQIGKVGLDSPGGWIAFANSTQGYAFTETFEYTPGADYPDSGATVEVWTVGAGEVGNLNYENSGIYLMETEVLAPMQTIQPGETTRFTLHWASCRCAGIIQDVTLAGAVIQPLRAAVRQDCFLHITGAFGVFDVGELSLKCLDNSGKILMQYALGQIDPLTKVTLDRVLPECPMNTKTILLAVSPTGKDEMTLSKVEV